MLTASNNARVSSCTNSGKWTAVLEDDARNSMCSRRNALLTALAAIQVFPSLAYSAESKSVEPEVTCKVFIEFLISGRTKALENERWEKIIARDKRADNVATDQVAQLVIGLYGKEAPESVEVFKKLINGTLFAPCMDEDDAAPDEFGTSEKSRLTKRQILRQCKAAEDKPLGYQYSQVWRIVKDQRIDLGRMVRVFRQAPRNEESNGLRHDAPGLLSVRRGGGDFDFTLSPRANPELDEGNLVIGRVLEGLDLVGRLNEAPVSQGQFLEGAFRLTGSLIGDSRARLATRYKPLQKITIRRCGILP